MTSGGPPQTWMSPAHEDVQALGCRSPAAPLMAPHLSPETVPWAVSLLVAEAVAPGQAGPAHTSFQGLTHKLFTAPARLHFT